MFKYLNYATMLKEIIEQGRQLKTVLYRSTKINKNVIPSAYSLLSLVLNNYSQLSACQERIAEKAKLELNNPYLLMVMIAEYINIGKIVGGGKVKRAIMDHLECIPPIEKSSKINKQKVQIRLRTCSPKFTQMKEVLSSKGTLDSTVPNLYNLTYQNYSQLTKDSSLNLLDSDACVTQSFSSCLPPFLLLHDVCNKYNKSKFDVIDACSAPGNKTIQLAEYLGTKGKVFAFEKNKKRFQLLNKTVNKYVPDNLETQNQDFLQVKVTSLSKRVKFILLDPSCSGSGMLTNFTRDANINSQNTQKTDTLSSFESFCQQRYESLSQEDKERVEKLHDFQLQLLTHAASFQPLRISYSTCSIYRRQNQDVVSEFLDKHPKYRLKHYKLKHKSITRGFGQFTNCVRVDPRKMTTDGFFVAVFTRGGTFKSEV